MKTIIMDQSAMDRALTRIAHEILEKNKGTKDLVLIGIQRRGVPLARVIADKIMKIENESLPVGVLDITFYRDDLSLISDHPVVKGTEINFALQNKRIVLVDDVIYTGRTIRAAIEAIFDMGRPQMIQLAVMIDRGHRELPFRPDFVGKNVPTSRNEIIHVFVPEFDGEYKVIIDQAD